MMISSFTPVVEPENKEVGSRVYVPIRAPKLSIPSAPRR